MSLSGIHLNSAAIERILKSQKSQAMVERVANEIARNVEAQNITVGDREGGPAEIPLPVRVFTSTTDRARATVALAHPAGIAVQAKHGALSKAAARAGLELNAEE